MVMHAELAALAVAILALAAETLHAARTGDWLGWRLGQGGSRRPGLGWRPRFA